MDTRLTLKDYLPYYPDKFSDEFNDIYNYLPRKYEFVEKQLYETEKGLPKTIRDNFRHQRIIERYMRIVDNVFVFHETGTGKTRVSIAVAESFKEGRDRAEGKRWENGDLKTEGIREFDFVDSFLSPQLSCVKRCYYISRSEFITGIFKEQLGEYLGETKRGGVMSVSVKREIERFYSITSYGKFYTEFGHKTDQEIIDSLSDTLFILDEVHNICHQIDPKLKDDENIILDKGPQEDPDGISVKDEQKYRLMKKILFLLQNRCKVLLMTATPMVDTPSDIYFLLGLLYPHGVKLGERYIKFPEPGEAPPSITPEEIGILFSGHASFYSASEEVKIVPIGEKYPFPLESIPELEKDNIRNAGIITPIIMLPEQSLKYAEILAKNKGKSFHFETKKASISVLPPGYIDTIVDNNEMVSMVKHYAAKLYDLYEVISGLKETKDALNDPDNLPMRGSDNNLYKTFAYFHYIDDEGGTEEAKKFLLRMSNQEGSRDSFLEYGDLVKEARKGTEEEGLLKDDTKLGGGKKKEIMTIDYNYQLGTDNMRFIGNDYSYRVIAIITSKTTKKTLRDIEKFYKHKDNWNGKYIRAIIATPAAKEGIDLFDTANIYMYSSEWNTSVMYQAASRAIRYGGHREILKKLGQRFYIKLYRVAAIPDMSINYPSEYLFALNDSINKGFSGSVDLLMYDRAFTKNYAIKEIEKQIKLNCFDTIIHRQHNITETTRRYVTGYNPAMEAIPNPVPLDHQDQQQNYRVFYYQSATKPLLNFINNKLKDKKILTIKEIKDYYSNNTTEINDINLDPCLNDLVKAGEIKINEGCIFKGKEVALTKLDQEQYKTKLIISKLSIIASKEKVPGCFKVPPGFTLNDYINMLDDLYHTSAEVFVGVMEVLIFGHYGDLSVLGDLNNIEQDGEKLEKARKLLENAFWGSSHNDSDNVRDIITSDVINPLLYLREVRANPDTDLFSLIGRDYGFEIIEAEHGDVISKKLKKNVSNETVIFHVFRDNIRSGMSTKMTSDLIAPMASYAAGTFRILKYNGIWESVDKKSKEAFYEYSKIWRRSIFLSLMDNGFNEYNSNVSNESKIKLMGVVNKYFGKKGKESTSDTSMVDWSFTSNEILMAKTKEISRGGVLQTGYFDKSGLLIYALITDREAFSRSNEDMQNYAGVIKDFISNKSGKTKDWKTKMLNYVGILERQNSIVLYKFGDIQKFTAAKLANLVKANLKERGLLITYY